MSKKNTWVISILVILSILTTFFTVIAETDIDNTNELGMIDIIESDLEVTFEPILVDELTEEIVPEIIPETMLIEELTLEIIPEPILSEELVPEITPEPMLTEELTSEPILNLQSEEFVDLVIMKSGPIYGAKLRGNDYSIGGDIVTMAWIDGDYYISSGFEEGTTWNFCTYIENGLVLPYDIYSLPESTSKNIVPVPPYFTSYMPEHNDLHYNHPSDIPGAHIIGSGVVGQYNELTFGLWDAIVIHGFPAGHYLDIYEKWDNSYIDFASYVSSIDKLMSYPKGYSSGYRILPQVEIGMRYSIVCICNLEGTSEVTEFTTGLKLSKILSAESFDNSEIFCFDIELTDEYDNPIPDGEYSYIKTLSDGTIEDDNILDIIDGKISVKLKHNESIEILDLPLNTKYKIIEIDADDFVTQITVNNAEYDFDIDIPNKTVIGMLNSEDNDLLVDIVYTNILPFTLPNSGGNSYILFIIGYIFLVLGTIWLYTTRKYNK